MNTQSVTFEIRSMKRCKPAVEAIALLKNKYAASLYKSLGRLNIHDDNEFNLQADIPFGTEHLHQSPALNYIESIMYPAGLPDNIKTNAEINKDLGWYPFLSVKWYDTARTYYLKH